LHPLIPTELGAYGWNRLVMKMC